MGRFAFLIAASAACAGIALAANGREPRPVALAGIEPGLWEVSRSATGQGARRTCLRELVLLATYAHAGDRCVRTIVADRPGELVVELACGKGDFGRSTISVITPRSLKIETQGFHRGEPHDYSVYARRVGSCPAPARR